MLHAALCVCGVCVSVCVCGGGGGGSNRRDCIHVRNRLTVSTGVPTPPGRCASYCLAQSQSHVQLLLQPACRCVDLSILRTMLLFYHFYTKATVTSAGALPAFFSSFFFSSFFFVCFRLFVQLRCRCTVSCNFVL